MGGSWESGFPCPGCVDDDVSRSSDGPISSDDRDRGRIWNFYPLRAVGVGSIWIVVEIRNRGIPQEDTRDTRENNT